MRLVLLSLLAVGACATAKPSEDVSYRQCTGGTPSSPPIVRHAQIQDTALLRTGEAGLLVIVDSSTSVRRIADAGVSIQGTTIGRFSNDSGRALVSQVTRGPLRLRVMRIGYAVWRGDVAVRSGFRDTLELGLGAAQTCLDAISVSFASRRASVPGGSGSRRLELPAKQRSGR